MTTHRTVALARSMLFVPGDRFERFPKARATAADMIVLDLEDGVDPAERHRARTLVAGELSAPSRHAVVRVSAPRGAELAADLAAIDRPALAGVMLPKAEDPADVAHLVAHLPQGMPVLLLIETPRGVLRAADLAEVPGVSRLALGSIDLQTATGIATDPDSLRPVRTMLTLASRAAGLPGPLDGVTTDLADAAAAADDARCAQRSGFTGKLCVHPLQIGAVNAVFTPTPAEVERAEAVMAAARAHGVGAQRVAGRMVDAPAVAWARGVLARPAP